MNKTMIILSLLNMLIAIIAIIAGIVTKNYPYMLMAVSAFFGWGEAAKLFADRKYKN